MKHFRTITVPFSDPDHVVYSDEDDDFYCTADTDECEGEGGEAGHVWLRGYCIFCRMKVMP